MFDLFSIHVLRISLIVITYSKGETMKPAATLIAQIVGELLLYPLKCCYGFTHTVSTCILQASEILKYINNSYYKIQSNWVSVSMLIVFFLFI